MAFTQITSAGFGLTTGTLVGVAASFSSTVSVGGTLTYEDVTNVDSVGLITARNGIEVTDKGVQVGTGATVDSAAANTLTFLTGGSERLRIASDGDVGVGTAAPGERLHLNTTSGNCKLRIDAASAASVDFYKSGTRFSDMFTDASTGNFTITNRQDADIIVRTNGTNERLRIDSSGRLLVGTSSSRSVSSLSGSLQVEGTGGDSSTISVTRNVASAAPPRVCLAKSRGTSVGSSIVVQSGDNLGEISFSGADGTDANSVAATILCKVDGTPGSNDMPGRLVFSTTADGASSPTERMRIDSSGRLGVATIPEAWSGFDALEVNEASIVSSGSGDAFFTANAYYDGAWKYKDTGVARNIYMNSDGIVFRQAASGSADASISWSESMRIDSSGNFGLGNSSPGTKLHIHDGTGSSSQIVKIDSGGVGLLSIQSGTTSESRIEFGDSSNDDAGYIYYHNSDDVMKFGVNASERMRIDSSGRLLIGTTTEIDSNTAAGSVHMSAGGGGKIYMMRNDGTVAAGNDLGMIRFYSNDGTEQEAARIVAEADASHGTDDKPGRILLMTTADNESVPTERLRLTSAGDFRFAMGDFGDDSVSGNSVNDGVVIDRAGGVKLQVARSNGTPMVVNRIGNDGNLINLRQAGNQEGTISVSGSSVSFNGGHLSRWSQLVGISTNIKSDRPTILRGSVLSNLDEMCEWGEEDNEQLNRMKVSDVEGDINVSGVFQDWDDDDDTYTNDFYCAMTGDFVIRIASGVTVQRGNLLMSAGDGTAKPQGDDIVRSKTIAKVTSTTVSTTYSDGSYCVPCVLMAC